MRTPFRHAVTGLAVLASLSTTHAQQVQVNLNADFSSDPTIVDGVVYFGTSDGRLHARRTSDGASVAGFPVDMPAASQAGGSRFSRPVVYYGNEGKGIYVVTGSQTLVRVNPDGTIAWTYRYPDTLAQPVSSRSAPAVTPDGEVFLPVRTTTGICFVKLRQSDGSFVIASPTLAMGGTDPPLSPAVQGANVYIAAAALGTFGVLDRETLTVKASLDDGRNTASPYIAGAAVYTSSSNNDWLNIETRIYKLNSSTLALDSTFGSSAGTPGYCQVGGSNEVTGPLFAPLTPGGRDSLYTIVRHLSGSGKLVAVDMTTGVSRLVTTMTSPLIGLQGMVYNRARNAFLVNDSITVPEWPDGPYRGTLEQVPLGNPVQGRKTITVPGWTTAPAYDPATNRYFVIVTDYQPLTGSKNARLFGYDVADLEL